MNPQTIGYIASALTVASFVPQLRKAWKSKSVDDISYSMVGLLLTSAALWIVYGVMNSDMPVILTNVGTSVSNIGILIAKVKFGNRA